MRVASGLSSVSPFVVLPVDETPDDASAIASTVGTIEIVINASAAAARVVVTLRSHDDEEEEDVVIIMPKMWSLR